MRKILRFLSSVYFAITLIALTTIWVIVGTFLESATSSHQVAESWVFHHPLFQLLLVGFFINILFSALSRYPFKKKHLPFLITHLGLLMVILGVFIKNVRGIQGHMQLVEGTASNELVLPNQKSLMVEQKSLGIRHLIAFNGTLAEHSLPLKLLEWAPSGEENYFAWKEIWGLPERVGVGEPLTVFFKEGDSFEVALNEVMTPHSPFLLIHQNKDETTLYSMDTLGYSVKKTFPSKQLESWIALDEGFGGYALAADLLFSTKEDLMRLDNSIKEDLKLANPPLSPPLELIFDINEFPQIVTTYLREWWDENTWLFDKVYSWQKKIPWNLVPKDDLKALYWIAHLFEEKDFLKKLEERNWPLVDSLKKLESNPQALNALWMAQLYAVRDHLPEIPNEISPTTYAKMLSAYFRLYGIHLDHIPLPENYLPSQKIRLESPLFRKISLKGENNPFLLIAWKNQAIPLVFDPKGTQLKWPAEDGDTLFRFQNHRLTLPYEVRLHQAQDIKYPGSDQTLSYECSLTIKNQATGEITTCHLLMNQVHETKDGFRFYLSGMGTIDDLGVKSVQLVVNRDPVKYFLTYPGGVLIGLGIILLFFPLPLPLPSPLPKITKFGNGNGNG